MKQAEQDIAVPPVEGVPGYYEILHRFSQAGNYDLVFRTEIDGKTIVGSFSEVVEPKKLVKDWYVFWGRLVVLLASGVTLMGASLSLKRRLTENPI